MLYMTYPLQCLFTLLYPFKGYWILEYYRASKHCSRLTARASLQRPLSNQILTAKEVLDYCLEEIKHIHVSFISKEETDLTRKKLEERFSNTNTLPGTQSFHHFIPLSSSVIAAKRVAVDDEYAIAFDLILNKSTALVRKQDIQAKAADFVVCSYDDKMWIGLVDIIEKEHQDGRIKFMHPHYPANSYYWPKKEDTCFVPLTNILCIIEAPCTVTGRQYYLQGTAVTCIEDQLRKQEALEKM